MNNYDHKHAEPLCATSEKGEKIFSENELERLTDDIGRRIVEAFDHLPDAEIAFLLKTNSATVRAFTDGVELPSTEMLLCINEVTGASIDWILTGKIARENVVTLFPTPANVARIAA